jgi:hypothetical protein
MAFAGSKRRVFPLQVQTPPDESAPIAVASAAQRSLLPPKSPLHGARPSAATSLVMGGGGFDRMLLLRNMNVSVPISGADGASRMPTNTISRAAATPFLEDVSAAQNLKQRKLAEARRRVEVQLLAAEDYTNTPEGDERRRRQDERARMREEELRMRGIVEHEDAQRRALQLQRQAEEEARVKDMYLQKRRRELEEQERVAREKEAARRQVLEAKMKALKEEADRKAREEYAARQKRLADEEQAERDVRTAALERGWMRVEDELSDAMRVAWLVEQERQRQIEKEAREWRIFEEREAERQREETQRRRDAQKEQYEQDRARRMQLHQLQQDRVRTAAEDKRRRRDQEQQGESVARLERLLSQCEQPEEPPLIAVPPPASPSASTVAGPPTARRPPTALETARTLGSSVSALDAIVEQTSVPPPSGPPGADIDSDKVGDEGTGDADQKPGETALSGGVIEKAAPQIETEPGEEVSLPSADAAAPSTPPAEDIKPELFSLETLRHDGVLPVAEVLSVTAGSPSSVAGLAPRDLLVAFGGITRATPKCIVAIAECVQLSVNQTIALTVLRPVEPQGDAGEQGGERMVQRCVLSLVPRKWKGKGLLGCQLSPFKWPTTATPLAPADGVESPTNATDSVTTDGGYDALVLHLVEPDSLAHRLGLLDGDVLARCGDLDVAHAGANASDALTAVASHVQTHWRDAQRELPLVVQRWDERTQTYAVVHVVLPSGATEPLGCALTNYTQYYYPSTTVTSAGSSDSSAACDECYYSSLASSLHAAALSGHVTCLQALLPTCPPECLDWRDDEGRSPLFYACFACQGDVVRCLVPHLMAASGPYDVVSGADAYGDSPLHAAAASDCVDAIVCLLETKFITDVDLANTVSQATAAHVAGSQASLRVLHTQFHADLLALDADGRMPLFYACLRNDPASVALLCELHPEFADYADSAGGNTPLHMAAWCGYGEVVDTLVASLPSIALFVPNQDGLDARTLALQSGWTQLAEELERVMARE